MRSAWQSLVTLALATGLIALGLAAPARAAAAATQITLANGTAVTGDFEVKKEGLFRRTATGGRLYRWADIDPVSLPPDVRDTKRRQVLDTLMAAHELYTQDHIAAAQPLYQEVYAHRLYLTDDDRAGEPFADISFKRQGYVLHDGQFVTFAARQRALGLELDHGQWRPAATVAEDQAFRQAFWDAKESRDPLAALTRLKALLEQYPQSRHRQTAEELMTQLRAASARPPVKPAATPTEDAAPPKLDDYYYRLPGEIEKPESIKMPDLKSRIYPDADERTQYPYRVEDGSTGYYLPKYWRDAQGYYHYTIAGIEYKSLRPPPLTPISR